jgi:hypothetical protein
MMGSWDTPLVMESSLLLRKSMVRRGSVGLSMLSADSDFLCLDDFSNIEPSIHIRRVKIAASDEAVEETDGDPPVDDVGRWTEPCENFAYPGFVTSTYIGWPVFLTRCEVNEFRRLSEVISNTGGSVILATFHCSPEDGSRRIKVMITS